MSLCWQDPCPGSSSFLAKLENKIFFLGFDKFSVLVLLLPRPKLENIIVLLWFDKILQRKTCHICPSLRIFQDLPSFRFDLSHSPHQILKNASFSLICSSLTPFYRDHPGTRYERCHQIGHYHRADGILRREYRRKCSSTPEQRSDSGRNRGNFSAGHRRIDDKDCAADFWGLEPMDPVRT